MRRRRKLWEVDGAFLCPVVGTCVPMERLRRLARRVGLAQASSRSDYELHHAAVHLAGERNEFSRLLQKELEARFAAAAARFAVADSDERLLALWRSALAAGDIAGALWALMTHPFASPDLLQLASQDVHMLSHQVGASSRADLRRLAQAEADNRALRERLEESQCSASRQLAAKEQRISLLERQLADAAGTQLRLHEAEGRLRCLEASAPPAQPDAALRKRLVESEARCARLAAQATELRRERDAAEAALQPSLRHPAHPEPRSQRCDLSGHRVLYVGGHTSLVEQYRQAVEHCGAKLLHHDGGIEESLKRLQPLLAAADVVVCAAGETSHAAYYIVKRFCKQAGKPCALLRRGSVASLVGALRALAGENPPVAAGDTLLRTAA